MGARAWYAIGSITVQPSEFAKVATALAFSRYVSDIHTDVRRIPDLLRAISYYLCTFFSYLATARRREFIGILLATVCTFSRRNALCALILPIFGRGSICFLFKIWHRAHSVGFGFVHWFLRFLA